MCKMILTVIFGLFSQQALCESLFDFEVKTIDGKPFSLSEFQAKKKKAFLIVNTASECGYTGQYSSLQSLYENYKDKGLVVLGFPSNDFGGQEPGKNEEIKKFCQLNYGVQFPLFAKGPVIGDQAQPLFRWLTKKEGPVRWNFEKFLVDANGQLVQRFPSAVAPDSEPLKQALAKIFPNTQPEKKRTEPEIKAKDKSS